MGIKQLLRVGALALMLIWAAPSQATNMYWLNGALTGGTAGSLDAISHLDAKSGDTATTPLATGDAAIVVRATYGYTYRYDAASDAAEASPEVIKPDTVGAGAGRWLRAKTYVAAADVVGLATVATSGAYSDLSGRPTLGTAAAADTGTGAGNVILGNDARLTDARTPTAHNQAWSTITSTPTTLAGYGITDGAGAPTWGAITGTLGTQTDLQAALNAKSGTGHAHAGTYEPANANIQAHVSSTHAPANAEENVNADWNAVSGDAQILNKPTLGTAAAADTGTGAGNVILGNDARLTDARTPTAHDQAWSTITSTPTTLAGYGITDGGGSGLTADQEAAIDGAALPSAANVFATMADMIAGPEGPIGPQGLPGADSTVPGPPGAPGDPGPNLVGSTTSTDLTGLLTGDGANVGSIPLNTYLTTETDPTAEPALGNPGTNGYVLASTIAGVRSWVASGGDMLKSIYDADTDDLIDEAAIASTVARDSEIPTNTNQLTNGAGFIAADLSLLTPTGSNFTAGQIGHLTATGVLLADADAEATANGLLVMATASITGADDNHLFVQRGLVTGLSGLTVGSTYYVSATAGAITATMPSTAGQIVRVAGYATSATTLWFCPDNTFIER